MASKQPFKLFDLKVMALKTWLNLRYFVSHSILMQKKNLLIIGDEQSELYLSLTKKLTNKWNINVINDSSISNQTQDQITAFYKQKQASISMNNIEAIVVLPETQILSNKLDFQDQQLITTFPSIYSNAIMKNIFAYRIASKYLSKTGVIILSCNQKQFYDLKPLDFEQYGRGKQKLHLRANPYDNYSVSQSLLDGPVTYLGVILGQRYELSLNSHSVIALSAEQSTSDVEQISKFYFDWMNRRKLPQPGSFARFISPNQKTSSTFVEYL